MDQIFAFLQQGISGIFAITILLGLLIFVHELGHFLVAKWCGVRVEIFSLGFGKRILEYKADHTTYCISIFPLGGYVKMFGDDPSREVPLELQKVSFLHKSVSKRIAIVLAGPVMNFLFAIVLFFIIAQIGEKAIPPEIGYLTVESKAYQGGFRSGDHILEANGNKIEYWESLARIIQTSPDRPLRFVVQRADEKIHLTVTPELKKNPNILSLKREIGAIQGLTPISKAPMVGVASPNSIAGKAGIRSGAIHTINGQEVKNLRQFKVLLTAEAAKSTELTFSHSNRFDLDKKELVTSKLTVPAGEDTFTALGFTNSETFIAGVGPGTPAETAGLKLGDQIIKIEDTPILKWVQILERVKSYKQDEAPLPLQVNRNGEMLQFVIKPKLTSFMNSQGQEEHRFQIGIRSAEMHLPPKTITRRFDNILMALDRGFERTWHFTVMTAMSFVRLFQAEISPKNIGGVITISQAASETFRVGIVQFLQMMAIISINLFILNLLPIPLLDGGHLLFYFVEVLRGAPVSLKKMEIAQQIGLLILVSLMVFAFFNDITRIMKIQW